MAGPLVALAGGRVTASEVLDLAGGRAGATAVRLRPTTTSPRSRPGSSSPGSGGGSTRARAVAVQAELPAEHLGAGLDRLLLGVAMAEDEDRHARRAALPLDDVGSTAVDLAGRFAEFVDRLRRVRRRARGTPPTLEQWIGVLSRRRRSSWRVRAATGRLAGARSSSASSPRSVDAAGDGATGQRDGHAAAARRRAHAARAAARSRPDPRQLPHRQPHGRTLVPMRSVPHRVVCLLGLDDGVFPRASVSRRRRRAGPRPADRRARRAQRGPAAVARRRAGRRRRRWSSPTPAPTSTPGQERPPAVPLGELLDALDVTTAATPRRARAGARAPPAAAVRRPQLRARRARGPRAVQLRPGGPRRGDRGRAVRHAGDRRCSSRRCPPRPAADVALADLQRVPGPPGARVPAPAARRRRPLEAEETHDAIPVELDAPGEVGDRRPGARARCSPAPTRPTSCVPSSCAASCRPDRSAATRCRPSRTSSAALIVQTAPLRAGQPRVLRRGRRPRRRAPAHRLGRPACGATARAVSYSRLAAKHRLRSWLDLLALSAAHPDQCWTAHAVGRSGRAGRPARWRGRSTTGRSSGCASCVDLYDRGLREPLPVPPQDRLRLRRGGAASAARRRRRPAGQGAPGVGDRPARHRHPRRARRRRPRPGRRRARAARVPAAAPRDDEQWNAEPHRLGQFALRIWDPLFDGGGAGGPPVSDQPAAFDIRDPLPTGTTLLEASAGTGKTWTIGALVTRYVAEGAVRLEQMLVVTFGRAASQELRERVRTQLVEAERALADPAGGHRAERPGRRCSSTPPTTSAGSDGSGCATRSAAFDAATIATTHQFCQLVLRSLGVAGDTDAGARLVEDLDDLLVEVVDDLYVRGFGDVDGEPLLSHADALRLARSATEDPQARLQPDLDQLDPATLPGVRVAFATEVREELDRRKRRLGVLSYDDLLSQLADALDDDAAPARERMRQRWQVVLVDEFQDTDPVQWQVLDRAFSGHATMVLIGDPKQAIYAFRGGDVATYLRAAGTATTRKTLATNRRTDAALLDSLHVVLRGAALGDDEIVVRDVHAHHPGSRLVGAGPPLRLRVVRHQTLGVRPGRTLRVPLDPRARARRPRPRHRAAADLRRDVRRPPAGAARRRGDRLPQPRPARGAAGARRPRRARGRGRQRQRLRHAGGDGVAAAAGGARAAAPLGPGPQRRPDVVLRLHRRGARPARRRPHRPGRRHGPRLGRAVHRAGRGRGARGGGDGRADGPGARAGRRGAAADRPAPRRAGAAPAGDRGAARPGGAADLAARADGRGQGRGRDRADPAARLRRGRGPAGHDPRQQGAGVPRRLPAEPVGPVPAGPVRPALPLRRRPRGAAVPRRRRCRAGLGRPPRPGADRGRRRVAAAALRRDDPGPQSRWSPGGRPPRRTPRRPRCSG